jgi:hypothetical protein
MRASTYTVLGSASYYNEAVALLRNAGDCVIVERGGIARQLVIKCPDNCGDVLSINVDRRSGPAWRLYKYRATISLFPSIDRPTGCNSHFILSRGKISWCDWWDWTHEGDVSEFSQPIQTFLLSQGLKSFAEIAEALGAVPWDILHACRTLVQEGVLCEGRGKMRGYFEMKR